MKRLDLIIDRIFVFDFRNTTDPFIEIQPDMHNVFNLNRGTYKVHFKTSELPSIGDSGLFFTDSALMMNGVYLAPNIHYETDCTVLSTVMNVTCKPVQIHHGMNIGHFDIVDQIPSLESKPKKFKKAKPEESNQVLLIEKLPEEPDSDFSILDESN